ncbi:MAG: ArsR family transcriptional regulator [Thermoplasmatales archaeon]|nr:MAG: ArsR family transcriptional regulator [Thermoplasmatales archaeon]
MERVYIKQISSRDKKAIKLFVKLGFTKNIAKTLIYISQHNECRSVDIERETNQRQPEVSEATQQLMKKGWIKKRDLRKKRKGRPEQIYNLAYSIDEILTKIEKEKIKEIEKVKKHLFSLKNLIRQK